MHGSSFRTQNISRILPISYWDVIILCLDSQQRKPLKKIGALALRNNGTEGVRSQKAECVIFPMDFLQDAGVAENSNPDPQSHPKQAQV